MRVRYGLQRGVKKITNPPSIGKFSGQSMVRNQNRGYD